tara:strand:+ start:1139 stop:1483 length:345 start_codon:yes stop_codon:yes gene_type:complete
LFHVCIAQRAIEAKDAVATAGRLTRIAALIRIDGVAIVAVLQALTHHAITATSNRAAGTSVPILLVAIITGLEVWIIWGNVDSDDAIAAARGLAVPSAAVSIDEVPIIAFFSIF